MRSGVAIAAVVLFAQAAEARGTCVITGKKVAPFVVAVAAREATPFQLRLEGVAAEVAPGGTATPATVHVHGALTFEATAQAADLSVRTRRTVEALNGMVRLAPATEKLILHANVRKKVVDAAVRLGGVELRGLVLPCDALTLDEVTAPKPQLEDDGSARLVASGKLLHFRGGPNRGAAMEVALDDPDALELKRLEEDSGWLRVTSRWPDGTTVAGWVRKEELTAAGMHHERIGEVSPLAAACSEAPRAGVNERVVAAAVAVGTEVYAARYLGPWARVSDGSKLQVRFRPKDDWVEIVSAPGVASVTGCVGATTIDDAWIPRSAARLPPDAAPASPPDGGVR